MYLGCWYLVCCVYQGAEGLGEQHHPLHRALLLHLPRLSHLPAGDHPLPRSQDHPGIRLVFNPPFGKQYCGSENLWARSGFSVLYLVLLYISLVRDTDKFWKHQHHTLKVKKLKILQNCNLLQYMVGLKKGPVKKCLHGFGPRWTVVSNLAASLPLSLYKVFFKYLEAEPINWLSSTEHR